MPPGGRLILLFFVVLLSLPTAITAIVFSCPSGFDWVLFSCYPQLTVSTPSDTTQGGTVRFTINSPVTSAGVAVSLQMTVTSCWYSLLWPCNPATVPGTGCSLPSVTSSAGTIGPSCTFHAPPGTYQIHAEIAGTNSYGPSSTDSSTFQIASLTTAESSYYIGDGLRTVLLAALSYLNKDQVKLWDASGSAATKNVCASCPTCAQLGALKAGSFDSFKKKGGGKSFSSSPRRASPSFPFEAP